MKLPKIALENKQFIVVLVLLATIVGIRAFLTMPRSEDPNPEFPNYTIIAVYPGTSPEDMEELVVDPIEDAIEDVDNISKIETAIEDGLAIVNIEGQFGIDIDAQFEDLETAINNIRNALPEDLYSLDIKQFDPSKMVNIQQLAFVSEAVPYSVLNDYAEKLQHVLEMISGIQEVQIEASPEEQVRVSLDFQKMAQRGIGLNQVIQALTGNNTNIPGGDVNAGLKSFNIKSSGSFKDIEGIHNTILRSAEGKAVYLRDIASIAPAYEDLRWRAEYMGSKCVYVTLTQKNGENIVALSRKVEEALQLFRMQLPGDIELVSAFEQAPAVQARISDFFLNLLQGVLLVGAVIFIFLGFRPSLVIMTVIPLSVLMAIGALEMAGYALQQISIAALVISLGLLVDNGIVVVENIIRFKRMGYDLKTAAYYGTSEVGYAIISSTATTLLAFFPLIMMESGSGEFLRSLPVTVILVLSASLLLALVFTPILSATTLSTSNRDKKTKLDILLQALITRYYRPAFNFALRKPWLVLGLSIFLFTCSLSLFPFIGVSFFPTADKPMLLIEVNTPKGTNIAGTSKAVDYVTSILDTTRYVTEYTSNTGHGNPTIYYNRIGENYKKYHGQILVHFQQWDPERFYSTLSALRVAFEQYPGAKITFRELKNGPPFKTPIEIKIIGEDMQELAALASQVETIMRNTPGTENVDNPLSVNKTNLKIQVNEHKAGLIGLPLLDIDLAIRAGLAGLVVDEVTLSDGKEYPLVIRMPFEEEPGITDFEEIYFTTPNGGQVPLKQVARLEFEQATSEISHYNTLRSASVMADVMQPDQTTAITEQIIKQLNDLELPVGYRFHVAGEYEAQQESFGDLGGLMLVALIAIFAVLVLQFRSVRQPLIVFSSIPMAVSGSFLALFISGWSFSFFAFVGFISLVGIVVNNSIILVDYTNQLRQKGMPLVKALKKAAETRFSPIVLTTTTTIVGLLPLTASGTGLWSPLGWTIIGGMVSSTLLTLLVVPILYKWLTPAEA